MNDKAYAGTYRAAMEVATGELDSLFEEARQLRNRMEQFDSVISGLKVLARTGSELSSADSLTEEMSAGLIAMKQQIDSTLGLVCAQTAGRKDPLGRNGSSRGKRNSAANGIQLSQDILPAQAPWPQHAPEPQVAGASS